MAQKAPSTPSSDTAGTLPKEVIQLLQEAVANVRHGTIQLIIQDGRVVQIDTTQKNRLDKS